MPDDSYPPPPAPAKPAEPAETWLASHHPLPANRRSGGSRSVLPWAIGAIVVLAVAVLAGYGTAYLLASLQHVPAPPAALLPTPGPSGPPAAGSPPAATATPDGSMAPTRPPLVTRPPQTPAATPRVHVVARGESLSIIAQQYGVETQAIIELNELNNPNLIQPGQVLLIPPPTGP